MARKGFILANYIAIADLHLQSGTLRDPDYLEKAVKKLRWVENLRRTYNATLLVAGDIFHTHNQPPSVINRFYRFSEKALCIAGNHDLPYSSMDFIGDSAYATLMQCNLQRLTTSRAPVIEWGGNRLELLDWGSNPSGESVEIQVTHRDLWMSPYAPGQKPGMALEYLKAQNARVVVSGHNHQSFCIEYHGKFLVNCGCMMHSKSREAGYKFKAWVIELDGINVRISPVECPIEDFVDVKETKEAKKEYMTEFIDGLSSLSTQNDIRASFLRSINDLSVDVQNYLRSVYESIRE